MNNQFMFMPQLNPYADNAKFIKKTVRPRHAVFMALGMAVMLTALLYGAIYAFSMMDGEGAFYESAEDMTMQSLKFGGFGLRLILIMIALALPCIGTVSFMVHFKDKESPYLPGSFSVMGQIFFVMLMLYSFGTFLVSFAQIGLALVLSESIEVEELAQELGDIFMMETVPSVIWLIWAISGMVFSSSVKKTVKCLMLSDKGTGFFRVQSVITVIADLLLAISYNLNEFSGGVFYSVDGSTAFADTINQNFAAQIMFNVYFAAAAVVIIALFGFAGDYRKAVRGAQLAFMASGSNLYMNGDSTAAAYYQNFYHSAAPNTQFGENPYAQPPQPASPVDKMPQTYEEECQPQNTAPSPMVCSACGAENPPDCKFCIECGNALNL